MSTYKITPLNLGYLTRPKRNFFYNYQGTEVEQYPINAYYLEGEYKILVDNGGCSPDMERGVAAQPYTRSPEQEIDKALDNIGVKPEDIDYIIFTHLHWDHAYNTHFFPKAGLICQKRELESLDEEGNPSNEKGYVKEYVKQFKYQLVEGDVQLFDGISVVLTPGHTIGSQSVVVDTEEGPTIICGDLIALLDSWRAEPPQPNGLFYNEEALRMMYASIEKLRHISKRLLPGHDAAVYGPDLGQN